MTSHKQNNTFEIQDAMKGLSVKGGDNSGYIELLRFNAGKGGSRTDVPGTLRPRLNLFRFRFRKF